MSEEATSKLESKLRDIGKLAEFVCSHMPHSEKCRSLFYQFKVGAISQQTLESAFLQLYGEQGIQRMRKLANAYVNLQESATKRKPS